MGALDFGKELLELNGNVRRLIQDVDRLIDKIEQHERRITLLEGTGDVIRAEAKAAASEQIIQTYSAISDQFGQLKNEFAQVSERVKGGSHDLSNMAVLPTDKKNT